MTHPPMSQNRVRDALEPTDKQIEAAAEAILACRGFGFYTDPMEGGQDAYDISVKALDEAAHALKAALTAPPASDAAGAEGLEFDSQNPRHWAEKYRDEFIKRMQAEAELRALAAAPTAPAQAPSRPVDAGGVEAVKEALADLDYIQAAPTAAHPLRVARIRAVLRAALATQPTGAEASRPVGMRDAVRIATAVRAEWEEHKKGSLPAEYEYGYEAALQHVIYAANKATPSQADAQTQEGGR